MGKAKLFPCARPAPAGLLDFPGCNERFSVHCIQEKGGRAPAPLSAGTPTPSNVGAPAFSAQPSSIFHNPFYDSTSPPPAPNYIKPRASCVPPSALPRPRRGFAAILTFSNTSKRRLASRTSAHKLGIFNQSSIKYSLAGNLTKNISVFPFQPAPITKLMQRKILAVQ